MLSSRRFSELWRRLGAQTPWEPAFDQLTTCYTESHRFYHTQECVQERLAEFDLIRHRLVHPDVIEMGLYWHRAACIPIQDGKRVKSNEARSAALCDTTLIHAHVSEEWRLPIALFILAAYDASPTEITDDTKYGIDCILSILGQRWARYERYAQDIAREWCHPRGLTQAQWREYRAKYLERMLARPTIFHTGQFRERYEQHARENMQRELEILKQH